MNKGVLVLAGIFAGIFIVAADDPEPKQYMWGKPLTVVPVPIEKVFLPKNNKANFTSFTGVSDVYVEDDVLKCELDSEEAILGWGNYMGKQPPSEMPEMPENWDNIELVVKGTATQWGVVCWRGGKRAKYKDEKLQKKYGKLVRAPIWKMCPYEDWTTQKYKIQTLPPDGLEVQVMGEKEQSIEIKQVKITSSAYGGYFRKTFELPDTPVWKALAQIGGWGKVFINEKEVVFRKPKSNNYGMIVKDIRPYLKPGKNVIAVHSLRYVDSSFFLFQCNITLNNGKIVPVCTDRSWKFSKKEIKGWKSLDFNDEQWAPAMIERKHTAGYIHEYFTSYNKHHYLGKLTKLKNPHQKSFTYNDQNNVLVNVLVPAGLKTSNPVIEYVFANTDDNGKSIPFITEKVANFAEENDSLIFKLDLGKQPAGVYTLQISLKNKNGILEKRLREPLMVLRQFKPNVVPGKSYIDGLDLELEDTIDFTNPNDSHPWFSAHPKLKKSGRIDLSKPWFEIEKPNIVKKNGLTYQVTDAKALSFFAYRFEFKHPGSWYLLELEYPDDTDRHASVEINPVKSPLDKIARGGESWSEAGVGYVTGGKFYNTSKIQKLYWFHGADSGPQILIVQNNREGQQAAVTKLRIFRIKNELPSIGGGKSRQFGLLTERCTDNSGFAHNFGCDLPQREQGKNSTKHYSMLEYRVAYLRYLQKTVDKYIQYLKFCGQNMYIMGMFQYSEGNTPFKPPYQWDTVEIMPEMRTVLAESLNLNGIDFYLNFQWCTFDSLSTTVTDAEVARGDDTVWRINRKGEQKTDGKQVGALLQNWMHPKIQRRFKDTLNQFADKFGHLKAFKGIRFCMNLATGVQGYYFPGLTLDTNYEDPFIFSYDDATFAKFEKYSGIKLPIKKNDPKRFQKRAKAIKDPKIKSKYIEFRCRAFKDFLKDILTTLRKRIPDAKFILDLAVEHDEILKYWLSTGRDYKDFLRDYAIDIDLLDATSGMGVGRWTIGYRSEYNACQCPYMFLVKTDPRVIAAYNNGAFRHVQIRSSWHESVAASGGCKVDLNKNGTEIVKSGWIPNYVILRSLPQPSGYSAREAFIQAIITSDPNSIGFGFVDVNLNVGHEQVIREIMKYVTHLPPDKFKTVLNTGLNTNLAIRKLEKDGKTYFYVANPGYWSIDGSITLSAENKILDLFTKKPVIVDKSDRNIILPVKLKPFGLLAFRVDSGKVTVKSFKTGSITEQEQNHMRNMIKEVEGLLADSKNRTKLKEKDQSFMHNVLLKSKKALTDKKYALAWSLLTQGRFWALWKDNIKQEGQQ